VVYELFEEHRGRYTVTAPWRRGSSDNLATNERETIDAVIADYGHLSGRALSALSHSEPPWREARTGLSPTDRSNNPIDRDRMQEYYGSLDADPDSQPLPPSDGPTGW
jgi:uncharacterized phage-associated protein